MLQGFRVKGVWFRSGIQAAYCKQLSVKTEPANSQYLNLFGILPGIFAARGCPNFPSRSQNISQLREISRDITRGNRPFVAKVQHRND